MLTMAQVDCITTLRQSDGKSVSEIARIMGISWRTAKKYADGEGLKLESGPRRRRQRPVMEPFAEVVDAWLAEDQLRRAKHRRTARVIHRQLRELDYGGSERTVRAYVRAAKDRLREERAERYVRLEHPPGRAQVDFGWADVIDGSSCQIVRMPYLTMSFPYSNAHVDWLLPAENSECFLHGLGCLFAVIGGIPGEIWFDHLSAAVKEVLGGGEREVTAAFAEFRRHYGFQAVFCHRGRGHEQGSVEGKVGYVRRNDLTPLVVVHDLEAANRELLRRAEADRERPHYLKGTSIRQLWADDRRQLLPLPREAYVAVKARTAVVNRVGEVQVEGERYRVPSARPGQRVFVKLFWDRIEVFDAYGEIRLSQGPRRYAFRAEQVDWVAELAIFRHKPRAIEHATCLKALPASLRQFALEVPLAERRGRVETLMALLGKYELALVEQTVKQGAGYDLSDLGSLQAIADYRAAQPAERVPLAEPHTPAACRDWRAELGSYNALLGEVTRDDG